MPLKSLSEGERDLYWDDAIHPSVLGYDKMAELMFQVVKKMYHGGEDAGAQVVDDIDNDNNNNNNNDNNNNSNNNNNNNNNNNKNNNNWNTNNNNNNNNNSNSNNNNSNHNNNSNASNNNNNNNVSNAVRKYSNGSGCNGGCGGGGRSHNISASSIEESLQSSCSENGEVKRRSSIVICHIGCQDLSKNSENMPRIEAIVSRLMKKTPGNKMINSVVPRKERPTKKYPMAWKI